MSMARAFEKVLDAIERIQAADNLSFNEAYERLKTIEQEKAAKRAATRKSQEERANSALRF
jgi:hypothetical protein